MSKVIGYVGGTIAVALLAVSVYTNTQAQERRKKEAEVKDQSVCRHCEQCSKVEQWRVLSSVEQTEGADTYWIYNLMNNETGKVRSVVVINRRIREEKQIVKVVD